MATNKILRIDELENTRGGLKIVNDYYLKFPNGDSSTQPSLSDSEYGMIRYNTDTKTLDFFIEDPSGAAPSWISLGLGTDSDNPQGDFMHRFGDIMFGDLRMANVSQTDAATIGSALQSGIVSSGSGDARVLGSDGIESYPSYTFANDVTTGLYRADEFELGISALGVEAIRIVGASTREETITIIRGDLQVQGTTTTVDSANLSIEDNVILLNKGETGTGVSLGASGIEVERGTGDNAGWFFDEVNDWWGPTGPSASFTSGAGTGITGPIGFTQTIGRIQEIDTRDAVTAGTLYIDGSAILLRGTGNLGSSTAAAFSFEGDENTGMYSSGADNLDFTVGGTNRLNISTTAISPTVQILGIDGTVSAPTYAFTTDGNTGMYSPSDGNLRLTNDGSDSLILNTAYAFLANPTTIGDTSTNPDGTLHVLTASAGVVTASALGDDLVVENTGNMGMSLIFDDTGSGYIFFGSTTDNDAAFVRGAYNSADRYLGFGTDGTERFRVDNSGHVLPSIDSTYNLGADATRWSTIYTDNIDATSVTGMVRRSSLTTTTGQVGTTDLPANAYVSKIVINVTSVYDNSATVAVTAAGGETSLAVAGDSDLVTSGVYIIDTGLAGASTGAVTATISGSPTVGAMDITVFFEIIG